MPNIQIRIRVTPEARNKLTEVAAAIVKPGEVSRNARKGSTPLAPMIRLLGRGVYPVRLSAEQIALLEIILQLVVDPKIDLSDPAQVGPAISQLLQKISTNQIKLIPK